MVALRSRIAAKNAAQNAGWLATVVDEGVVVAVVLGHEPIDQVRIVRVQLRDVASTSSR
jgi:hypothetical protein